MSAEVQAPLYALVAATGLAAELSSRADLEWPRGWRLAVRFITGGAASVSAFKWLVSVEAGIVVEAIGGIWVCLIVLAASAIVRNATERHERREDDEADQAP